LFGLTDVNKFQRYNKYNIGLFVERYTKSLEECGISHWLFSKKYGLSESALRRWKKGDIPSMESLVIIATNLPVSIDYLIGKNQ